MTSLSLHGLRKSFGPGNPAVDGVDLDVEQGEMVVLLGPSGCGKTTLLRLITGFLSPDDGRIEIGGRDVTRLPPYRRDIGIVYQSYALWPHMTVWENVSFGLEMRKIREPQRRPMIEAILDRVGLAEYGQRYPRQLSGGQQQRVALARALVVRPEILLLDEPLSSLDAKLRAELRTHIREIQQDLGVTAVFVTHDQEEALAVADRVVLMNQGQIVEAGSGEDLYSQPRQEFTMSFMGEINVSEGNVGALDDGQVWIDTALGRLCSAANMNGIAVGHPVRLGIRPESVVLQEGGSTSSGWRGNELAGVVGRRTFLGPWVRYEVEISGVKLIVKRPTSVDDLRLDPGTAVSVIVPPTAVLATVASSGAPADADGDPAGVLDETEYHESPQ